MASTSFTVAQEHSFYTGGMTDAGTEEDSYSWRLEYLQGLGEHVHFTCSWVNEGHVLGHHRGGHTLRFWLRRNVLNRKLSLAIGAGAYVLYDTQGAPTPQGYADVHGTGAMMSASAGYYLDNRVVLRGQLHHIWGPSSTIDTWSALIGVGYQLQAPLEPGPRPRPAWQPEPTVIDELTVFVERTVVNSYKSEKSVATKVAYRRGLTHYLLWSIAFVNEGDPWVIRRDGVTSQIWAARTFLHDKLEIGLGAGFYCAVDEKYKPGPDDQGTGTPAGLITPSFGWRFAPRWGLRLDWDRTVTSYDRDTDIFGLGVGYRF